ncbi:surface lipoprotein assembly modifier [Pseudothauera rhizosphaerae]|uniref:DUF560 domain-containing protein n=1 Tax=Pseudothauera rhizosphaerae TaxID=2565932 RepID=A0A4S4ATY9_9RHOO|nr:surface lipoprotein assembly modifier [Pseudothauera rhizosphaerae]THF62055.1 DUF560 domain-containing protein [Pseudothauera rhizosphaerae]
MSGKRALPIALATGFMLLTTPAGAQGTPPSPSPVIQPIDSLRPLGPAPEERFQTDRPPARDDEDNGKAKKQPVTLSDEDVKSNPQIAEFLLSTALQRRDWSTLARVIPIYRQIEGHDPLLVHYTQGALYRQQRRHDLAIAEYRQMLRADPGLNNVRFDMAAMLFENKQYREAAEIFTALIDDPALEERFREFSLRFLEQIRAQGRPRTRLRFRVLHNDNVNQATDERFLEIGGWIFRKSDEYMPKSSYGTNYSLFLDQAFNVRGNHFLTYDLSLDGLRYNGHEDFNEKSATLDLGYKYQDVDSWFSFGPLLNRRWLGGEHYGDNWGLNAGYGKWLTNRWQATLNAQWIRKDYADEVLSSYNGDQYVLSPGVAVVLSNRSVVFGGLAVQRERLEQEDESYRQYGANLGFSHEWESGFSVNGYVQYGRRKFDETHFLFLRKRKDHRINAVLSVGHARLSFFGIEPRLSYQLEKIDSNIPALYSRKTNQWMLSLERTF